VRIGVDARELTGQPTGVGRYLSGLLAEWSTGERARRHEFVLYAHEPLTISLDTRRFATRIVSGAGGTWWEQRQLPAAASKDHLDVFFAPGYTAPLLLAVRLVVAIHDVSFAAHPEWFTAREGFRRRLLSRRAAAAAIAVITISEFSRGELVERLGVPESRIHVIPPGVTQLKHVSSTSLSASTAARPSVLYVGSIFNRRHVPDLVRAFGTVARSHSDATLQLVGENRSHPHQDIANAITREGLNGCVRWRAYVPDQELSALYRSSRAFAFLSEYEGLGLTPLEALAAGTPSVLLDTPVARESCGEAALYARRGDIAGIGAALERLLFDQGTRDRLLGLAPAVLSRYNSARAAERTLAVLEGSTSGVA
jgi:glycosyltransferase involved in cell wall biosynthesis